MPEYIETGKIVAIYGLKGELVFNHQLGQETLLKGMQTIFTKEKNGDFFPWFLQTTKLKSDTEIYLKIEGIDTPEQAKKMIKKAVWFTEKDFKKFAAGNTVLSFLGFIVFDKKKRLGPIVEIIEQPHQLLCRIVINKKDVLVPLHQDFLQKADMQNRELHLQLPEGLIEVYLE